MAPERGTRGDGEAAITGGYLSRSVTLARSGGAYSGPIPHQELEDVGLRHPSLPLVGR